MQAKTLTESFIRFRGVHMLLWLVLSLVVQAIYYDPASPFLQQWLATLVVTGMCAGPAYYGAYRLVPRLLYRKKIGAFVGASILVAAGNSVAIYLVAGFFYHLMTGKPMFPSLLYLVFMSTIFLVTNVVVITISCAVKVIADRFSMEERLHEVEQEQISTELAFLRSQINPHFLFNILNTIYFQIHKDNTEARGSVEKLSELLRYQLYECTSDTISIAKELAYIENYVAMQRLRMEAGTDVLLDAPIHLGSFKIAPLLILPIIENAFKHISHHKIAAQNRLHIILRNQDNQFVVQVINTYDSANGATHLLASGGLGLQNVKRRLDLLYPDSYSLDISRKNGLFETVLKINYRD